MATTISNDATRIFKKVETLTDDKTLIGADSGKVFMLNAAGGGDITLPSLKSGANFKFIIGATAPTTAWTVTSSETANINGVIAVDSGVIPAEDEDVITFVANTSTTGDFVEFECDGSNWYVSGIGDASGSITATT